MEILYPIFTLSGWTLVCMARLGILRFTAVRRGEINPKFFALYRGYDEPEKLAVHSRHVVNLFEAPVLFYVVCVVAFVTNQSGALVMGLAWAYVALRLMHSYVHLTSNIVLHRFRLFVTSWMILVVLWAVVLTGVMRQ